MPAFFEGGCKYYTIANTISNEINLQKDLPCWQN